VTGRADDRLHRRNRTRARTRKRTVAGLIAAAAAVVLVATACKNAGSGNTGAGGGSSAPPTKSAVSGTASADTTKSCHAGATRLVFWNWNPGIYKNIDAFNQSHPGICVQLENVGAGEPEYNKLLLGIRTHTGLPDVALIEYSVLPEFELTNSLLDLGPYGANSIAKDFSPWVWNFVKNGSAVDAIPQDIGPMGLLVNQQFMDKYHVTIPTTWAQLAQEAAKVHQEDPNAYLTNFDTGAVSGGEDYMGLLWQAAARPFQGTSLAKHQTSFNLTSPQATMVNNYWQSLISKHLVTTLPFLSDAVDKKYSAGQIGMQIVGAWTPAYFSSTAVGSSVGHWVSAPLPQWSAGANVSSDWGGSSYAVLNTTKHAAAAATFAIWSNTNLPQWRTMINAPATLFPSYVPMLHDSALTAARLPLTGNSPYYGTFVQSEAHIQTDFSWNPFEIDLRTQLPNAFDAVATGSQALSQAMAQLQKQMTSYAQNQGFTVTSG
jgi:multiple sugar transport system substrate-binding protein